jgi:hypothetical protein
MFNIYVFIINKITFSLDFDVKDLITEVYGIVLNIPIPLLGVDKKNVCTNIIEEDGTKKNCPLQKGSTYIYKDDIYIIETYPKVRLLNIICIPNN